MSNKRDNQCCEVRSQSAPTLPAELGGTLGPPNTPYFLARTHSCRWLSAVFDFCQLPTFVSLQKRGMVDISVISDNVLPRRSQAERARMPNPGP